MHPEHDVGFDGSTGEPRFALRLDGCTPTPLASYLKALGVLRLVAEQKDPTARGWWEHDVFHLESVLDRGGLREFLLAEYEPTPIIGPWGARSGFYPGNSESSARKALEAISGSDVRRLEPFRSTITTMRDVLRQLGVDEKADAEKQEVLAACRSLLPDDVLQWLDACYVLVENEARYPPILGTGGNEGSGSYSSGFSQTVVDCILERSHDEALDAALNNEPVASSLSSQTPGQFDPGKAGGVNGSTGFESPTGMGAWDYLLTIEGTLCFSSAGTRRHDANGRGAATFPFMTNTSGAGSGAVAIADEAARRGEMWCPLWHRPARYDEVAFMFREGRITLRDSLGQNRLPGDGLGFARAVATLGVDRGIHEFERFGFLQRHGRNVVAVPLGRRPVSDSSTAQLVDDLDAGAWLARFRKIGRDKAPARLTRLVRHLESAIFDLTLGAGSPRELQRCLVALGECQHYLSTSPGAREKCGVPIPDLSEEWVERADDGSPEFSIAAGLAGLHGVQSAGTEERWTGRRVLTMAEYMAPVDSARGRIRRWIDGGHNRVVWSGGAPDRDLASVMARRVLDQNMMNLTDLPLFGDAHLPIDLVAEWLTRPAWDRRIAELLPGLALVGRTTERALLSRRRGLTAPAAYCLLKPFFVPTAELQSAMPGGRGRPKPIDLPAPAELIRLLRAKDPVRACGWARTHLRAQGLVPPNTTPAPIGARSTRLLAALMVPIRRKDLNSILIRYFGADEDSSTDRRDHPDIPADTAAGAPATITSTKDD